MAQGAWGQKRLTGKVSNSNNVPISGARVELVRVGSEERTQAVTDPSGAFLASLPGAGEYRASVDREGYFRLTDQPVLVGAETEEVQFFLTPLQEVIESVEVHASRPGIDMETTDREQKLSGTEILNVPYPTTNSLQNAMRIIPGVTQDTRGGLHLNGGASDQVFYTLDGFNVADPLTGRLDSRISVEAVQSVEVLSGRYSAEYGKGSSGTVAINTRSGGDQLRYAATNFIPGIENRKGLVIGNWTPRLFVSGPIRRGRAWFSDSFDTQYDKHVVEELPKGEDRIASWRFSNMLHSQVNLSPSNILQTGMLTNWWNAPRTGLSALDPIETTVDRRSRQWFFHVKDQIYMARGAVFEFGVATNRTFQREIPQGHELYEVTPDGKRGNFYVDGLRTAGRDQIIANYFFPSFSWMGGHLIKAGMDLDRLTYSQDVRRTGYTQFRFDRTPLRQTIFGGSGVLGRSNREVGGYLQDSWKIRPNVLVELGLRYDWDRIVSRSNLGPRVGVAWAPAENTKLTAGFGAIYDATSLRIFTRPQDQYSLTTYFDEAGRLARGPALSLFTIGPQRLSTPKYRNYSVGIERRLPGNLFGKVQYLRRRGVRGFTYFNTLGSDSVPATDFLGVGAERADVDGIYDLGNFRRDEYDSLEATFRQPLKGQYEWLASYTHSRARSNAVVDISVDTPTIIANNSGPLAWDAPHRLVTWGYLPTPWKDWAWAYLAEWRNGYPFSITTDDGRVVGAVNSSRFPAYVEVNLHLERRFRFRGQLWALRGGFNNLTNRQNPNVVNSVLGGPNFMQFYGGQHRTMNFRIRWLGKL